jgi:hypothetical protein
VDATTDATSKAGGAVPGACAGQVEAAAQSAIKILKVVLTANHDEWGSGFVEG